LKRIFRTGAKMVPSDALTRFTSLPENRSAHEAVARLAAAFVGRGDFPLLVLHGPPGSGKSHLVAGLIERVVQTIPDVTAQTAAAAELGRTLLMPPAERQPTVRDLGGCDLLAVEDLQHLPPGAADDLAAILDRRQARRKPTVVTAVRGPADLGLPARLTDRLAGGLVVGIAPLGPASRVQLAQALCSAHEIRVTEEVISWLAQDPGGGRPILGNITRLGALAKLHPPPLSMRVVTAELVAPPVTDGSALDRIATEVAARYRVGVKALKGQSRVANVVWPRQVAMYAARAAGLSLAEIGRYFGGRDHTTVLHACEKVADRLANDPGLGQELRDLGSMV
jgi:chromosomal replication initiator protein